MNSFEIMSTKASLVIYFLIGSGYLFLTSATDVEVSEKNLTSISKMYSNNNLGEIIEGVSFTITDRHFSHSDGLSISLIIECPIREIALYVKPHLSINHCSQVSINVAITDVSYVISVNGNHYKSIKHRLPYKSVTRIEVNGFSDTIEFERNVPPQFPEGVTNDELLSRSSVQVVRVKGMTTNEWNSFALTANRKKMPHYGILPPRSFGNGKTIRIEAGVNEKPETFTINLQDGYKSGANISFHFNPRFKTNHIAMNTFSNNYWLTEESVKLNNKFYPLQIFSLRIVCGEHAYEVFLNDKFIANYKFVDDPLIVDTALITGDVQVWDVVLEDHTKCNAPENMVEESPGPPCAL